MQMFTMNWMALACSKSVKVSHLSPACNKSSEAGGFQQACSKTVKKKDLLYKNLNSIVCDRTLRP